MWIFGYGSLIWKPGFDWVERRVGFVRGWQRRFYQGSFDHRGVPGNPGRVVTLLPDESSATWGVVFRIEGEEAQRVLARLDHREKGGYQRHRVPIFDGAPTDEYIEPTVDEALVYVATENNPNYLGPAPPDAIARQVFEAKGPSGHNAEYVMRLAESLRQFEVEDPHVFAIDAALRKLLEQHQENPKMPF